MNRSLLAVAAVLVVVAAAALFYFQSSSDGGGAAVPESGPAAAAPRNAPNAPVELAPPEGEAEPEAETPALAAAEEAGGRAAVAETAERAPSADPVGARLVGRVVDREGRPLAGARVRGRAGDSHLPGFARRGDGVAPRFELLTDADGRFETAVAGDETLEVSVRASGYAPLDRADVVPRAVGETDLGELALSRGAILRGVVVDASGAPLAGADLHAEDPNAELRSLALGGRLASTAPDGTFMVEHLACGPWRLRVRAEGHPDGVFEGRADRPGQVVDGLELALPAGGLVAGSVVGLPADADTDELEVRVFPVRDDGGWSTFGPGVKSGDVQPSGGFRVAGLLEGEAYRAQLRRRGARVFGGGGTLSESVPVRVGDEDVVLEHRPESRVLFQAVDARTGLPVERMSVRAGGRWALPVRDESGRPRREFPDGFVEIDDVRAGDEGLRLEVRAPGYEDLEREGLGLPLGGTLDLGVVRLEPVPVVRVTVVDDATGRPIEGARVHLAPAVPEPDVETRGPGGRRERRVSIELDVEDDGSGPRIVAREGAGRTERTDADGLALISSFEGETCTLSVEAEGYAPARVTPLVLPEEELIDQEVRLARGADVLVTVVDPDGEPVAGARVSHRGPDGGGPAGFGDRPRTDPDGRVRFAHLAPGLHGFALQEDAAPRAFGGGRVFVAAALGADEEDWTEVEVGRSGEVLLTLETEATGTLTGRVTERGLPLAGAVVELTEVAEAGAPEDDALSLAGFGPGPRYTARTDGEGRYEVEDVVHGGYTMSVEHTTRRMPAEFAVEVEDAETTFDVDLSLAVVEGTVTDREGNPLVCARVTAQRARGERPEVRTVMMMVDDDGGEQVAFDDGGLTTWTETDAEGRYVLRGVLADEALEIAAEHPSAQPGSLAPVRVGPDEVRGGVDLVLDPGGSLRVEARRADGSPARFVLVTATYQDEAGLRPETSMVGPAGQTTLEGLRPGRWLVEGRPMGRPGAEGAGEAAPVEVVVAAGETVTGTLTLE